MNITQTFWTAQKDPLKESFGWLSPRYNLMSWTLSCLCLKEYYEDVVLYTDSLIYSLFVEKLHLPYDRVIVAYDNIDCHESLWAIPKLMTYADQSAPFMHVDGDVFICRKLPERIETASLIAQTKERGTAYYKNMMNPILQEVKFLPECLKRALKKEHIRAYNAGVIGGNNISFIQSYCQTAFEFIETNKLNTQKNISINYNILFEQILFYALSMQKPTPGRVETVTKGERADNGYTYEEFCDFSFFKTKNQFMHIIGSHKRNPKVCDLLARTLLHYYPEYYFRIVALFPEKKIRETVSKEIEEKRHYEDYRQKLFSQWRHIPAAVLWEQEKQFGRYFDFLSSTKKNKRKFVLKRNAYVEIYEDCREWQESTRQKIKVNINRDFSADLFDIAVIPEPVDSGFSEVLLDDICYNILTILEEEQTFVSLLKTLRSCIVEPQMKENKTLFYDLILAKLDYLFYHKLIYI